MGQDRHKVLAGQLPAPIDQARDRSFVKAAGKYQAYHPLHGYTTQIQVDGKTSIALGEDHFDAQVSTYWSGAKSGAVGVGAISAGKSDQGWPKISVLRSGISEAFVNERDALHHWMFVQSKPEKADTLWVKLAITGDVKVQQESSDSIRVVMKNHYLAYRGLKVWDARGRTLPATMVASGKSISIRVDDTAAKYPITIDPIWTTQQKLVGPAGTQFGSTIATSDGIVIVGNPSSDGGEVYLYGLVNGIWTKTQTLKSSMLDATNFGRSLAIDHDTLAIGYLTTSTANIDIYVRQGTAWYPKQTIAQDGKGFGDYVSVADTKLTASDPTTNDGSCYFYERNGTTWAPVAGGGSATGELAGQIVTDGAAFVTYDGEDDDVLDNLTLMYWDSGSLQYVHFDLPQSLFVPIRAIGFDGPNLGVIFDTPNQQIGMFRMMDASSPTRYKTLKLNQMVNVGDFTAVPAGAGACSVQDDMLVFTENSGAITGNTYVLLQGPSGAYQLQQTFANVSSTGASEKTNTNLSLNFDTLAIGDANNAVAYVYTRPPQNSLRLKVNPTATTGGSKITGTVTLSTPASYLGKVVNLTSDSSIASIPSTVTIPAGKVSADFAVLSQPVDSDQVVTLSASAANFGSATATLNLQKPRLTALTFVKSSVFSGSSTTGTVKLNGLAPRSGITVSLSANPNVTIMPSTVLIQGQVDQANFTVTGKSVTADTLATVTAQLADSTVSGTLLVKKLLGTIVVTISPNKVSGVRSLAGHITVSVPTGPKGLDVTMVSDGPYMTLSPTVVSIPAKSTSATFVAKTVWVGIDTLVSGMATAEGYASVSGKVTLVSPRVTGLTLDRSNIGSGGVSVATVTLDNAAPEGGVPVTLTTTPANIVKLPNIVTVPRGAKSTTFNVTGTLVAKTTKVSILAAPYNSAKPATINVIPGVELSTITVADPIILAGKSTTGTVTLGLVAPPGGQLVTFKSSDSKVSLPASLTVPAGQLTATFPVKSTGTSPTVATLTATTPISSKTTKLTVVKPKLIWLGVAPTKVSGGGSATLTVKLQDVSPPFGVVVTLSSGNSAVSVPSTFTIPAGVKQWTATITTAAHTGSDLKVTLTARIATDPAMTTSITVTK